MNVVGLVLLAIIVAIAIWLAIVVIKWLFILAIVAGLIWLIMFFMRRARAWACTPARRASRGRLTSTSVHGRSTRRRRWRGSWIGWSCGRAASSWTSPRERAS